MNLSGIGTHFGTLAIEKEYITINQLIETLVTQVREDLLEDKHRLIGEILIDKGFMDVSQVDEVLSLLLKGKVSFGNA